MFVLNNINILIRSFKQCSHVLIIVITNTKSFIFFFIDFTPQNRSRRTVNKQILSYSFDVSKDVLEKLIKRFQKCYTTLLFLKKIRSDIQINKKSFSAQTCLNAKVFKKLLLILLFLIYLFQPASPHSHLYCVKKKKKHFSIHIQEKKYIQYNQFVLSLKALKRAHRNNDPTTLTNQWTKLTRRTKRLSFSFTWCCCVFI